MCASVLPCASCLVLLAVFGSGEVPAGSEKPEILPSGLTPDAVEQKPYRQYARECIELLIAHGTDRYGKVHSPILMNILDVRTRSCPENPLALDEAYRVIRRDRRGPAGANLYPDQPTLRACYALSQLSGDPRFAAAADAQAYAYAYGLTRDPELLVAARRWADSLRRHFPPRGCQENTWYQGYARDFAPHGTYAEHYGRAISFLLHLHWLTGQAEYQDFARQVADESVAKLYYQGLLRGHPAKPYYESLDGVGYLLYALLQLDESLGAKGEPTLAADNW